MELTSQAKQFYEETLKQLKKDQKINNQFMPDIQLSTSNIHYIRYSKKYNRIYLSDKVVQICYDKNKRDVLIDLIKSILPKYVLKENRVVYPLPSWIHEAFKQYIQMENKAMVPDDELDFINYIPYMHLKSNYLTKAEIEYFKEHLQIALRYMYDRNIPHLYYVKIKLLTNLGRYTYGKANDENLIISAKFIRCCYELKEDKELENTLIHEYLHTAFPQDYHKGNWKKWAKIINEYHDYEIYQFAITSDQLKLKMEELTKGEHNKSGMHIHVTRKKTVEFYFK